MFVCLAASNGNIVKILKVYGHFCHVRLHQTYVILHGHTKLLKLKFYLPYSNIRQIRLINTNKNSEQIMVSALRKLSKFNVNSDARTKLIGRNVQLIESFVARSSHLINCGILFTNRINQNCHNNPIEISYHLYH